jgi:IclR helix-turn-helix domain
MPPTRHYHACEMAKRADTQTAGRAGRKTGTRHGALKGHGRHANGKLAGGRAIKSKSAAHQVTGARTAAGRRTNGAGARAASNGNGATHGSADGAIALTLTSTQVRQIMHAAGGGEADLSSLLEGSVMTDENSALTLEAWEGRYREELDAGSASSSLLRGLLILACFPRDGSRRSVHSVAERTGMEMSTTHRYVRTLLLLGFLEQDPKTRAYGRVTA